MHARRGTLTGCVEPRELTAPVEIGEDPSDGVVGGGCNWDRGFCRVIAFLDEAPHKSWKTAAVDRAEIEKGGAARCDLTRHDIAGRKLVREPLTTLVQKRGALPT